MGITGMNHAVLYVRNAGRSATFYREVLGFSVVSEVGGGVGVFMRAPNSTNDHDIAFFTIGDGAGAPTAGHSTVGLYHLAWEVSTLEDLAATETALREAGALVGAADHVATKSLYAQDVDGLEFEVCWVVPRSMLDAEDSGPATRPLDLPRELERYGATTAGGR